MNESRNKDPKPSDVLIIGDSMIKRLQVYGHEMRVWKFCYPGGTAEDMNGHIATEKLPGEALIGAVIISMGTNDLSRSRNRIRSSNEVFEALKLLIARMAALYPQALIIYVSILPRLDYDHERAMAMNRKMKTYILGLEKRFDFFDYSDDFLKTIFPGPKKVPLTEYYRDFEDDTVHLSDSGTQVQQDAFNRFLGMLKGMISRHSVDLTNIMWQVEWDKYNYWYMKTSNIGVNKYLESKRLTNFTEKQHLEILGIEKQFKRREVEGPLNKDEVEYEPAYRHLGDD